MCWTTLKLKTRSTVCQWDVAASKSETKLCHCSREPLGDTVSSDKEELPELGFFFFFFFLTENDVIATKDKCHTGTFSFIHGAFSAGMWRLCWLIPVGTTWNWFLSTSFSYSGKSSAMMQLVGLFQSNNNSHAFLKGKTCTFRTCTHTPQREHSFCQRSPSSYFTLIIQTCSAAVTQHSFWASSLPPASLRAETKMHCCNSGFPSSFCCETLSSICWPLFFYSSPKDRNRLFVLLCHGRICFHKRIKNNTIYNST